MFGYIVPHICELKVGEHNLYKAIYCGLCKNLKKNYGHLFTLFLSYDMVFFVLIAINLSSENLIFEKQFCSIHPLKKRACLKSNKCLDKASDLTIILTYFKLKDKHNDEKKFKKLAAKLMLFIIKKAFKKASLKQPSFLQMAQTFIKEQASIEAKNETNLDKACHPTAWFVGEILKKLAATTKKQILMQKFGYMLGRYIYLTDAVDDIKHDFKQKNYNPFIAQQNCKLLKTIQLNQQNKIFQTAYNAINLTLAHLTQNFYEIQFKKFEPIISNIVLFGLKINQKKIFKKHDQLYLFKNSIHSSSKNLKEQINYKQPILK